MATIGYARVSTQDQDTALQLDALHRAGCTVIYQEKASGASRRGRPELARCLSSLRRGDTLVFYKIDRIARSLFDLLDVLHHLETTGAMIKSITEPLDTTNPMGVFMIQVLGSVAQLERSMIRERSIAGLLAAHARGVALGRRKGSTPPEVVQQMRERYATGEYTYPDIAREFGVHQSTAKRLITGRSSRKMISIYCLSALSTLHSCVLNVIKYFAWSYTCQPLNCLSPPSQLLKLQPLALPLLQPPVSRLTW